MNVNRYIANLLLFCFSAFLGHNLVAHHHHAEIYFSSIATDCPIKHGDHQENDYDENTDANTDGHPTHCHALNDVVFKKHPALVFKFWTWQAQSMYVSSHTLVLEILSVEPSNLFICLKLPRSSHTDIGTRDPRAPPAFA